MKIVLTLNRKTSDLDWFIRHDPGPVPPIVNPPNPDEAKDTGPPEPPKDNKPKTN